MTGSIAEEMAFFVGLSVKAAAIFGAGALLVWALRRSSASLRHRAGTWVIWSAAALPIAAFALPGFELPVLPARAALLRTLLPPSADAGSAQGRDAGEPQGASALVRSAPSNGSIDESIAFASKSARELRGGAGVARESPARAREAAAPFANPDFARAPAGELAAPLAWLSTAPRASRWHALARLRDALERLARPITLALLLGLAAGMVWLLGTALLWARLASGLRRVSRLSRQGTPAAPQAQAMLARAAARLGLDPARPIRLLVHPEVPVAMTAGSRKPVVLLPSASASWSDEKRQVVLLHELAHVRRGDWLQLVSSELALGVWWFHPLAWWLSRSVRRDAEQAADDLVLAAGTRPSDYAAHLLEIVRGLRDGETAPRPAMAMAQAAGIEERVRSILDERRRRGPGVMKGRALACALGAAALLLAVARPTAARASEDAAPAADAPIVADATNAPLAPRAPAMPSVREAPHAAVAPLEAPDQHEALAVQRAAPAPLPAPSPKPSPAPAPAPSMALRAIAIPAPHPFASAELAMADEAPAPPAPPAPMAPLAPLPVLAPIAPLPPLPPVPPAQALRDFERAAREAILHGRTELTRKEVEQLKRAVAERAAEMGRERAQMAEQQAEAKRERVQALREEAQARRAQRDAQREAMDAQRLAMATARDEAKANGVEVKIDAKKLERQIQEQVRAGLDVAGRKLASLGERLRGSRDDGDDDDDDSYARGMRLHDRGRFQDSISAFQKAIDDDERPDAATYNIACDYAQLGDAAHAAEWLKKAADEGFDADGSVGGDDDFDPVRADPKFRAAVQELRSQRGDRHAAEARALERRYQRLAQRNPKQPEPWNSLGKELLDAGSYDLAFKSFQAAAERASNPGNALYNGACALSLKGDKAAALDQLQRAIEQGFDDVHQLKHDDDLDAVRDEPRFKELVQLARDLELDVGGGSFQLNLGSVHIWSRKNDKQRSDDDLAHYQEMAKKHAGLGRAQYNLGYAQLSAGDAAGAEASFGKAASLGYRKGASLYNQACAQAREGHKDAAFASLKASLDAGFDVADAMNGDDDLESLHSDPRYRQLKREAGDRDDTDDDDE